MRPLHGEKDRKRTTWDLKPLDSCKRKVSNSGIHNYNPSAGNDRHCWLRAGEGAAEVDVFVEFSPCTRAEHGVGYGIGVNLVVWAGVVLVLLGGFFLPRLNTLVIPVSLPIADRASTCHGSAAPSISESP